MRMNLVEDKATVDTQHVISPRPKTTCPATKCSAPVPERTILSLTFEKIGDKKSVIKIGDKKSVINEKMKETIIAYLTDHAEAKTAEIAAYIGLKLSRTRDYLNELIAEDIVVAEGGNRNRTYRLRS